MRLIPFLVPTLLLAACSQPAPPPAETAPTSPPVATTAPPDEAPAAGLSPDAVEPAADAAQPPAAAAPAAAGDVRQRIDSVLGDAAQYEAVFIAFQKAVNGGDRAAVVEEVRFPLKIANGATIAGPGEFQRNYERILTPAVRKAIAAQTFDTVMVNQQGVMIGDGQVWLNGACLDKACSRTEVKVVTIQ
ncbi:hypothetical protein ACLB90_11730 [Stenotrophomonas sp. LGBM10]|uniref:hypothetical protein n=1 Tax=Stenotrophomonas sp. LGBM10 TaxID=3390038 RepID=UPI00398AAA7A